jgi:hypothetical protein
MVKRSKCIEDIKKLHEREGRINLSKLEKYDDIISKTTFYRNFNSTEEAAEEAGVEYEKFRKIEIVCNRCGNVDRRPPSFEKKYGGKKKEFCDNCSSGEVECDNCGSIFEKPTFRIENNQKHYCDRECYEESSSNNVDGTYYSGNWHKIRNKTLQAFGKECYCCGRSNKKHKEIYGKNLDVHHNIPLRKYEQAEVEPRKAHKNAGLTVLCKECHMQITNKEKTVMQLKVENNHV